MIDLKAFRRINGLRQQDVADYLGVSRAFIALVESNKSPFPYSHESKLLNNNKGWDVSTLTTNAITGNIEQNGSKDNIVKIEENCGELSALRRETVMLREQLEKAEARNAEYWEMIKNLTSK